MMAPRTTLQWFKVGTLSLMLLWLPCWATTVYKVVDEDGNITYTDKPPQDAASIEALELQVFTPATVPDSRALIEQMATTTDRLKQDRLDREAQRQQDNASGAPPPVYGYPQDVQEPQPYWYYPYHRPHYPHRDRDDDYPGNQNNPRSDDDRSGPWYVPLRAPRLGIPDPLRDRREAQQSSRPQRPESYR